MPTEDTDTLEGHVRRGSGGHCIGHTLPVLLESDAVTSEIESTF